MRTLIFFSLFLVAGPAGAAGDLTLSKVMRANTCGPKAKDPTCSSVAFTYCSSANNDQECKSFFPGDTGPKTQTVLAPVRAEGDTIDAVRQSAEQSDNYGILEKYNQAQKCCGTDLSGCSFLPNSDAEKANNEINSALTSGGGEGGLKDKCAVYEKQTDNANKASSGVAGMCKAYKTICSEQYKALADAILKKGSGPEFVELANTYKQKAQTCDQLTPRSAEDNAKAMKTSSLQGEECKGKADDGTGAGKDKTADGKPAGDKDKTAGGAAKKEEKGGMDGLKDAMGPLTQALQAMTKSDEKKDDVAAATPDCSNPATAGCFQTAANAWTTQSTDSAGAGGVGTGGKFNVADTGGVQSAGITPSAGAAAGSPISVQSVPGGGGGMGAMGGGGGANLGNSGGGQGGGYAAKSNTDIMHGEGGGGGGGLAAMNAGMSTAAGAGAGGYNYGKGQNTAAEAPVDWRQFLPGGAKDPTRKLAGATAARVEIQSVGTNIFNRVSERIRARCAQGLLRDCN